MNEEMKVYVENIPSPLAQFMLWLSLLAFAVSHLFGTIETREWAGRIEDNIQIIADHVECDHSDTTTYQESGK
ncbi:hypothetical protein LCGC14_1122490 [marine sediment metagenome]|uniref:Uncharacterized protein n=1 Tax=marine sediment metagenome TaxID=412755 RepID=A0A0F9M3I3_9ZZZZ